VFLHICLSNSLFLTEHSRYLHLCKEITIINTRYFYSLFIHHTFLNAHGRSDHGSAGVINHRLQTVPSNLDVTGLMLGSSLIVAAILKQARNRSQGSFFDNEILMSWLLEQSRSFNTLSQKCGGIKHLS